MSDYLFLINVGDEIINTVSLSKFTSNRRSISNVEVEFKVGVYTQDFDSMTWDKIDEIEFNDNNIVLNSTDYRLRIGRLAVIIPCDLSLKLQDSYVELPKPISRKVDLSPINERAEIHFYRRRSFSSYQGEFPYQMSRIKGTFLAFDALAQITIKDVKTKIVFVNIYSRQLFEKNSFSLNIANIDSKEILINSTYVHNSAGIVDVPLNDDVELCFYSKDTLGIPIFISYNNSGYLSVEHTHPPTEYFWNNKFKGQQLMKENWMSQLP